MLYDPFSCKVEDIQKMEKQEKDKDINVESFISVENDGARINKLAPSGKIIKYLYEDAKTLVEVVERGCRVSGNGKCLGWINSNNEYSWLNYEQFIEKAKHFGSGLVHLGANLGQSTFIGIYAQNSVEWLVAQHGCFNYSTPIIPLYDTLGPDACRYMINHGEIKTIICDEERKVKILLDKKDEMPTLEQIVCVMPLNESTLCLGIEKGVKLHLMADVENIGKMKPVPTKPPKPTDLMEICYTSGTTGNPKAALLSHENIVSAVSGMVLQMQSGAPNKNDVMISYLPLAHVLEQICEIMVLMNGGSFGFFSGNVTKLLDDMKILQPTLFPAVPRLLNKLFDKAQAQVNSRKNKIEDFENEKIKSSETYFDPIKYKFFPESLGGKVKHIISAAAPISETVLRFYLQTLKCHVSEVYGQTELAGPTTTNVVTEANVGCVGPPLPCCMIKLEDVPELGYFKANNAGEVCVKGYNVFQGYYKDPERTAETFDEEGWLHTGDIAVWLPSGTLRIIDRKKHIFKLSQGEYVAPEKLENVYLHSPYIAQILIHGETLQSYLVAIVVPDEEVVISWCKENSQCSTFEEACKNPTVKQLILDDMQRISKTVGLLWFEQVKKIRIHPKLLTYEEGHLTPTLKTKRAICRKLFTKEIQEMYDNKDF